jgi:hypothetical protein
VHTALVEHQVAHFAIPGAGREKQAEKLVLQFGASDGYAVALLAAPTMDAVLPWIAADSIIVFDGAWSPDTNPARTIAWMNRASGYPPMVFRLITQDSFEALCRGGGDDVAAIVKLAVNIAQQPSDPVRGSAWTGTVFRKAEIVSFCEATTVKPLEFEPPPPAALLTDEVPRAEKPPSPSQFWVIERVRLLTHLLSDFGIERQDRFSVFGRSQNEIYRVASAILRAAIADDRPSREIEACLVGVGSSDLRKSELSISRAIHAALAEIEIPAFIRAVECAIVLHRVFSGSFPQPQFERAFATLPSFAEAWAIENDRALLEDAYAQGLSKCAHPLRAIALLEHLATGGTVRPIILLNHGHRKFTVADHTKILAHLMSFGYPSVELFNDSFDLAGHSLDQLEKYVSAVLRFCFANADEKKTVAVSFPEKIPKYTAGKIPARIQTFTEIRAAVSNYQDFPAEDIEFLRALSVHGFVNFTNSPVLTASCAGNCSEIKLFKRMKVIFAERHRPGPRPRVPEDIRTRVPLRINDMLVCTSIGEIDGRPGFHTRDFIYPIGYKCCCVCQSPVFLSTLVWLENAIVERNGKPFFVVRPREGDKFEWSGFTPDEPYMQLRALLAENSGKFVPPFDGHEMFGLTSALVNLILMEQPRFRECHGYANRFFLGGAQFVSKWPVIGQFEREPERHGPTVVKFKYKKKAFGDLPPPLVVDFSMLLYGSGSGIAVDVLGQGNEIGRFALFCESLEAKRDAT